MKQIYYGIFVFFFIGCATTKNFDKSAYDAFRTDMASLNKGLRGQLYRNQLKNDLSPLNEEKYVQFVHERGGSSEKKYTDFLKSETPRLAIASNKTNFVVCLIAIRFSKVICDNGKTAFTDYEDVNLSLNLKEKAQSLLTD